MKRCSILLTFISVVFFALSAYPVFAGSINISEQNVKLALKHEVKGNELDDAGKLEEAISEYEKSLELNPFSSSALFNLGLAYLKAGRNKEAIYTYERAVDLEPNDAELYKLLGIAYIQEGLRQKAIAAWEKSLSLNPDQPRVKRFIEINQ